MPKGLLDVSILSNIGKAIRYVNELNTKYAPGDMPSAIRSLKNTFGPKTITENGTYSPSADNLDGYSEVTVTVEGGSVLVSKNIVQNGTYDPTDDNADGYSGVTVNVPPPVLVSKNITANGNYSPPDDNADGYSSVSVAVPGAVLQTKTATANGTVTPDSGYDGLSSVAVAVPNTYSAADNGKVVSNGQLVAQTSRAAAITENGTFDTTENNSVTVNVSGGGTAEAPYNDVIFIDYDGKILYSYSAAELAALSALPTNPSHEGLTAQGWNWSLSDAKAHVAKYGALTVGQMYITQDGKTRIYIHLEEGRLSPVLGLAVQGTARIEWGDGDTDTVTGNSISTVINTQHNYASHGDYVISLETDGRMSTTGEKLLWKNSTVSDQNKCYRNAIRKIEIGSNFASTSNIFAKCYSLSSVTIPTGFAISMNCFADCYALKNITIPDGVNAIVNYGFSNCNSLSKVSIPNTNSIGSSAFSSCYALDHITIPDNVSSIETSAFSGCRSLAKVSIPDSVSDIATNAFKYCYGLAEIHFKGTTPPTVASATAWDSIPTDCKIYVPTGSLSAYTSAANYPSSATYTYIEE